MATPEIEKNIREGRNNNQLRNTNIQLGIVKDATGSAYIDLGNTKIIASVYGPRKQERKEFKDSSSLYVDLRFSSFARNVRKETRQYKNAEETSLSTQIRDALTNSVIIEPKFAVDVHIMVLEDDGAVKSCAITCASAALVSAGIGMKDITIGASAGVCNNNIYVDPTREEQEELKCIMEVAYNPNRDDIQFVDMQGSVEVTLLQQLMSYCIQSCREVHELLKTKLVQEHTTSS